MPKREEDVEPEMPDDEGDLDENDPGDLDEPEEEEVAAKAASAAPVTRRRGRRTRPANVQPDAIGLRTPWTPGAKMAPGSGSWGEEEADRVWPKMIIKMREATPEQPARTPYEMSIQVIQLAPPPARQIGRAFEASLVVGDRSMSAGDALMRFVTDHYHLPIAKYEAEYEIRFYWKATSDLYGRGRLRLGTPEEIEALRLAEARVRRYYPTNPSMGIDPYGAYGAPSYGPPYGAPPPSYGAPPPPPPAPAPPIVGPPPAGGSDGDVDLRVQLHDARQHAARVEGQLHEMYAAMREGRLPRPLNETGVAAAAAPAPPPAPPAVSEEEQQDRLLFKLARMGVISINGGNVGPPVAAAPPPPVYVSPPAPPPVAARTSADIAAETTDSLKSLKTLVATVRELRGLSKVIDGVLGGTADAGEAVAEVISEGAEIPFATAAIPEAKWANGLPIMYAQDKRTGKFSWTGVGMANASVVQPAVEKVIEGVVDLLGGLGKIVGTNPVGSEPSVVSHTPSGARDANGSASSDNGGWPSI